MNAFETVTIVVSVVAIVLAATSYFRVSRTLDEMREGDGMWMDHLDEREIEQRPAEDASASDPPIPRRRLRGRPEEDFAPARARRSRAT
jgi:hypothetical protein